MADLENSVDLFVFATPEVQAAVTSSLAQSPHAVLETASDLLRATRLSNGELKRAGAIVLENHLSPGTYSELLPCKDSVALLVTLARVLNEQPRTDPLFVLTPTPKIRRVSAGKHQLRSDRNPVEIFGDKLEPIAEHPDLIVLPFDPHDEVDMKKLPDILNNL